MARGGDSESGFFVLVFLGGEKTIQDVGVAQNERPRVSQVLVVGPICS